MPVEQREQVIDVGAGQLATGGAPILGGRRQPSFDGTSRMTRECQVRICERLGVRFPGPTRLPPEERNAAIAAAEREGLTIGEWLTRAIRTQVQTDHRSDRLPVALDPPALSASDPQSDLADLERVVALAK